MSNENEKKYREERDMLGEAIRNAAVKAGIIREDVSLTGPMLTMLCDNLAELSLSQTLSQTEPNLKKKDFHMNNYKDPALQFGKALADAGLILDGPPIMDGKLHRVPAAGDKRGEKSGAYAGHLEGKMPGGFIQNFKTGEVVKWKAEGIATPQLSPAERAKYAIEAAQARKERDAAISAEHEATATAARQLWNESWIAKSTNPYCVAKNIIDPIGLRTVPHNVTPICESMGIRIVKTPFEAKQAREADPSARVFKAGDLLVPGRDADGKLWTLQSINPYFKSLMKGGKKHGMFAVAGTDDPKRTLRASEPVIIAEGFATASTVSRLLGQPVVVAFDSGNLDAVAGEFRKRFPDRSILIAADNDHAAQINVGLNKAHEAAAKHNCGIMTPPFEKGDKGTDWNDYAAKNGDTVTEIALNRQKEVALQGSRKSPVVTKEAWAGIKTTIAASFDRLMGVDKELIPIKNASREKGVGYEM